MTARSPLQPLSWAACRFGTQRWSRPARIPSRANMNITIAMRTADPTTSAAAKRRPLRVSAFIDWDLPATPNGSKLTGLEPHAKWYRTWDAASCGSKSGAAQS
jgi:hypothetical protein